MDDPHVKDLETGFKVLIWIVLYETIYLLFTKHYSISSLRLPLLYILKKLLTFILFSRYHHDKVVMAITMQTCDHTTMKRRNQSKYHRAVVTFIFMFLKIYKIFSSYHISQTYINNQ